MSYENGIGLNQQADFGVAQGQWTPEQAKQVAQAQHQMLGAMKNPGAIAKQPGLMDALRGAHDLVDRLSGALNGLEDRLSPILGPQSPSGLATQNQASAEPAAIEEMVRMLLRLQGLVLAVENISSRVRV